MDANLLALYTGYAFAQAVQVQSVLEENSLLVPFVVHWRNESPTAVPYPAETQEQAVQLAIRAREDRTNALDGWSSGREGLLKQNGGPDRDVLLIEAWVPGLTEHLVLFHYYSPRPFVLVGGFNFKGNPEFKRSPEENKLFSHHFRRGISSHPFGGSCLKIVEKAVSQWPTATGQNR
jgi:hypothetical protein